jgi:O-acetyl-ADP-ribose deacetylase (regulator of RNase III)
MKIQLIDRSKIMCNFWNLHFKDCHDVLIHNGDIFSLSTDCIVSPANSFGFMDGGLDAIITSKIGIRTQEKLQTLIKEQYDGELLVGQAVLIETEFSEIPYCISAPTMRVSLLLRNTVNAYLAARAAFRLVSKNPQIQTVTMSGLGTGVGQLYFDMCAKQMKQAYDDVFINKDLFPKTFTEACKKHQSLIK